MKALTSLLPLALLALGTAQAAMTVVDHPQGVSDADDLFYNSLTDVVAGNPPPAGLANRYSMDVGDVEGQSFTLASAITLHSIYLGYNDQQSTGTFDLLIDVGNNGGTADYTFEVTVTNALQSGGGNNGPYHFLQFDLSAENISLGVGVHSFSVEGTVDNGEGGYLIAPIFTNASGYAGGQLLSNADRDLVFAVTAIPEPSTLGLIGLAGLLLMPRRRR